MPAWLPIAAILAVALALRLWGVPYGLPNLYNWDEPTVVNRAVRFGGGDLNPHFFYYPTLWMYLLAIVFGGYFAVGRLSGHFHSASDFVVEYLAHPTSTYLIARVATALAGVATVWLVYRIGMRLMGREVGILAAALLSVSVIHVAYSQQAVTDVPHTLFIAAALLAICAVATRGRRRDYLLAGVLIGLGTGTKYLAILLVAPLLLAHFHRRMASPEGPRPTQGHLLLAFAGVAAAFFVAAPYCFLDFGTFLRDYRAQAALSAGAGGTTVWYYLFTVIPGDLGWPTCLLAALGCALLARRPGFERWVLLSFPFVYFSFVARYPKGFPRYVIPLEPVLVLLASYGIWAIARRAPVRACRWVAAGLGLVCIAYPLWAVVGWNRLVAGSVDPRTRAASWCLREIPPGSSVAVQSLFDRTFLNAPILTDAKLHKVIDYLPTNGKLGAVRARVTRVLSSRGVYREMPFDAPGWPGADYVLVSSGCGPLSAAARASLEGRLAARFGPDPARLAAMPSGARAVLDLPPTISIYRWTGSGARGRIAAP
jgi:hypothetical protein